MLLYFDNADTCVCACVCACVCVCVSEDMAVGPSLDSHLLKRPHLRGRVLCFKLRALTRLEHTNSLWHSQRIHTLFIRMGGLFGERNRTKCAYVLSNSLHQLFSVLATVSWGVCEPWR